MVTIKELLKYSQEQDLAHIPSALSHLDLLNYLYFNKIIDPLNDNLIIGKPFGAQSYYLIWKKLGLLENIEKLSYGVKHNEIPFVDFSEETLGNALGVGIGICLANNKLTWVHLSDGAFQMGPTLEALQFLRKVKIPLIITVDANDYQLTGTTKEVMNIDAFDILNITNSFGLNSKFIDKDYRVINESLRKTKEPLVLVFKTKKGNGIPEMELDPIKWHYKKLEEGEFL